jgi:hypothetical protein
MLFRQPKPPENQLGVRLGCDSAGRFLLKHMEHVDRSSEPHCVDTPIRVAAVILDNLKNSRPFAFPRLRPWVFPAELGDAERRADFIFDRLGES